MVAAREQALERCGSDRLITGKVEAGDSTAGDPPAQQAKQGFRKTRATRWRPSGTTRTLRPHRSQES